MSYSKKIASPINRLTVLSIAAVVLALAVSAVALFLQLRQRDSFADIPSLSRANDPNYGKDIAQVHIIDEDIVENRLYPAPCSEGACDEGDLPFDEISITYMTQLQCQVRILLCAGHHAKPDTILRLKQPTFIGGDTSDVSTIRRVLASANVIYVDHDGITLCKSGRCRVTGRVSAASSTFGMVSAKVIGCATPGVIYDPRKQPAI